MNVRLKLVLSLVMGMLLLSGIPLSASASEFEPTVGDEGASVSRGSGCDAPMFLSVGDFVSVQPGLPNRVRSDARLDAPITSRFQTGSFAQILAGPACADGLRWWYVGNEVISGWTAEGDAASGWLVRLNGSPLTHTCALPPRLSQGEYGVILPGDANAMRNGPDQFGNQNIGRIPAGGEFLVLGNSLCGSDGRRWYPVNYQGKLGWTAEGEGSTYWISPIISVDPPPDPVSGCNVASRLGIGDFVTVDAGLPNRVHSEPRLGAPRTGTFPNGGLAQVLSGPICADGLRWWHVGNEVIGGWTAEGNSEAYWLIPLIRSPFLNVCPLPPRLVAGNNARVLTGDANALRNGPDQNGSTVIGRIPGGAQFEVLGDSLCGTDGRRWYPVRYNGRLGWTAEGEGNQYWIEPLW